MIKRYYFVTVSVSPINRKKRIKKGLPTICIMIVKTKSFFEVITSVPDYALKLANKNNDFESEKLFIKSINRI